MGNPPWRVKSWITGSLLLLAAALLLPALARPSRAQGVPFLHRGRLYSVSEQAVGAGFWELGYEAVLGEDGTSVHLEQLGKNTLYLEEKPHASAIVVRRYDARADRLGAARRIPAPAGHQFQQLALRGTILYVAGTNNNKHFLGWVDIAKEQTTLELIDAVPLLKDKPLDDLVVDGSVLYGIDDIVAPKWMVVYDLPSPTKPSLKGLVQLQAGLNQAVVKAEAGPGCLALLCRSVYRTGSALYVELYDTKTFALWGVLLIDARGVKGTGWSGQELSDVYARSDRQLLLVDDSLYVGEPDGGVGGVAIPAAGRIAASRGRAPVRKMEKLRDGEEIPVYFLPDDGPSPDVERLSVNPVFLKTASGELVPVYDLTYVPALSKYVAWRAPGARADLVTAADLVFAADASTPQSKPVFARSSDRFPALISPRDGVVLDSPRVTFSWSAVQDAAQYEVIATMHGPAQRERVVLEASTPQTSYTADLDLGDQAAAAVTVVWSVRARYADERLENWQERAKFTIKGRIAASSSVSQDAVAAGPEIAPGYVPPRPNDQVTIAIDSERRNPVADGKTVVRVSATVKDLAGKPVPGARVRFVLHGYHSRDGRILGADERLEVEVPYQVIPSGMFIEGNNERSIVDALTDGQGLATARYRVPHWADYMDKKPVQLGVWYDCDGGGNPIAQVLIYFQKP